MESRLCYLLSCPYQLASHWGFLSPKSAQQLLAFACLLRSVSAVETMTSSIRKLNSRSDAYNKRIHKRGEETEEKVGTFRVVCQGACSRRQRIPWQRTVQGWMQLPPQQRGSKRCCLACLVQQAGDPSGAAALLAYMCPGRQAQAAQSACLTYQLGHVQITLPSDDARYPASRGAGVDQSIMCLPAEDQDIAGSGPHHGWILPIRCGGLR